VPPIPVSVKTALIGLATGGLAALACGTEAQAQSYSGSGSAGSATYQSGYGNARYSTGRAQTGSTRDANGNRLIVDGIIQPGASSYSRASGAAAAWSGAGSSSGQTAIGGATAIGNSLNVVVQGSNNTVIVNSTQINNGDVTAGTALNGTLDLP
jgi:holdfast attachment protein HfaA